MQQLKAMLIKEWHTHKKTFLIPLWVLIVIYVLGLVSYLYGSIRYGAPDIVNPTQDPAQLQALLWGLHYGAAIFISWLCLLTSFSLVDVTLNQDHHKRCEIFHLSQPVSLIKFLGSKALFSLGGVFVLYIVLALANYLIIATVSTVVGFPSFALGLNAVINTLPYMFSALFLIVPLMWFFSSMFRKTPLVKMLLFFVVYEVLRLMLNMAWNLNIFSILKYYNQMIFTPFEFVSRFVVDRAMLNFSFSGWSWNTSWEHLIWFGVNVVLVIASYFIYKRRNIS